MSDTPKFTPGPWRFDDAGPLSGNIVRLDVLAGTEEDPFRVCEIDDSVPDIDQDNSHARSAAARRDLANACLIAAAPDLYAACKAAVGPCERCGLLAVADVLRAALAKAEGRTP